ncbi:hypothetical protein Q1695_012278 [Nippostrongylus brasiliensis]|nr:hypothetical protein Q1695_012278 [Nippostrongylus brasiliensis]
MLVEDDELCGEPADNSYGYAPSNLKNGSISVKEECDGAASGYPPASFLRTELNVDKATNFVQATLIRADCSPEAIESSRRSDVKSSQIDQFVSKLSHEDASLLSAQLERELNQEWSSASLYNGLGVDHSGLIVGGSLLQTYDLLCNINLQVLTMQRELLSHEKKIRELCFKPQPSPTGFSDADNKAQLHRLLCSLNEACLGLRERVTSMDKAVMGFPSESETSGYGVKILTSFSLAVGLAFLGLSVYKYKCLK